MRSWFPFTDYDFYGYLASGFALLFALDLSITGGEIMLREKWSFVEVVLAVSLAYATGQIAAMPSSILLEHGVARKFLHPPLVILIGASKPRWREKFVSRFLVGRHYEPFDEGIRQRLLERAVKITGKDVEFLLARPETIFALAFSVARSVPDARIRMDDFRNQYGLNRNMSFVGFLAAAMLSARGYIDADVDAKMWAAFSLIFGIGLFARFLKFYSAFAAELLRTFAFSTEEGPNSGD